MNQVIRIIFDDNIPEAYIKGFADGLIDKFGNIAAIEIYEEEFTDKDNNDGKEQRQKEPE